MWVFQKKKKNSLKRKFKVKQFFKKSLNNNVPAHAKIQNTINREIIAQLKAPHMS